MDTQLEHTATLVVRVWTEGGGRRGLRCRVTSTVGLSAPQARVLVVDSVGDLTVIVRTWLESFMALLNDR